jgi:hypothetical protein
MLRGVCLLLMLGLVGCDGSASAKRAEVRSISFAIDRLRQAPNPEKAPKLEALSKLPCSLPDTCQLRDHCVGAYQLQVEAVTQIAVAKEGLDGDAVTAIEKKLEGARKLAHECLEFELVVGRRFGTQP